MPSQPERVAKTQYIPWKGRIIAYSLKVGSTTIFYLTYGKDRGPRGRAPKIGQYEAANSGQEIHLFVRHPLDRLVSGWKFFTQVSNSYIKPILDVSFDDHEIILGSKSSLEEWIYAARRHYNPHWEPQAEYHSRNGVLVPTHLWPLEALPHKENASPRESTWEQYYTPELREECERWYVADIELYEKAKENWNAHDREGPSIF